MFDRDIGADIPVEIIADAATSRPLAADTCIDEIELAIFGDRWLVVVGKAAVGADVEAGCRLLHQCGHRIVFEAAATSAAKIGCLRGCKRCKRCERAQNESAASGDHRSSLPIPTHQASWFLERMIAEKP